MSGRLIDMTEEEILKYLDENPAVAEKAKRAHEQLGEHFKRGLDSAPVLVDRKLLEEALEQIEATWLDDEQMFCLACIEGFSVDTGNPRWPAEDLPVVGTHKPDCRYVRVVDGLKKALGK